MRTPTFAAVRDVEAFMVDEALGAGFRLSEDAQQLLRLVDGARTERDIAVRFMNGDTVLGEAFLPSCRAFFDECVSSGLLRWNEEVAPQPPLVIRPRARLG